MIEAKNFIQKFEDYCPQWLSEEGDSSGLQVGTLDKKIENVMVTLDIRPEVVQEAIEKKIDLIFTKHAPIFRPVTEITSENVQTNMLIDLIKHDIAVYVAHTNMDIVEDGLNDWFCEALDITADDFLRPTHQVSMLKLSVFVPVSEAAAMRKALGKAGAGEQGNSINTSYSIIGTGRFTPVNQAQPAIGALNQEEAVQETKIEVIFPETIQQQVIAAMIAAHPYEEPAFDVIQLVNHQKAYGLGRIGNLERPISIERFIEKVKKVFEVVDLRVVYPTVPKASIQRVAICGGSGEKFYRDALSKQADVYITSDVYYHTAHDMQSAGLTVIDPGHYMEHLCKERLVAKFKDWQKDNLWEVNFISSEVNTNPFTFT